MNVFAIYSGINDTLNEKSFNLLSATESCAVHDEREDRPTPGDKGANDTERVESVSPIMRFCICNLR